MNWVGQQDFSLWLLDGCLLVVLHLVIPRLMCSWCVFVFTFLKKTPVILNCSIVQSCPTLYNPMGCSPSDSSVHGIFPASRLLGGLLHPTLGVCMLVPQSCVCDPMDYT